MKSIEMKTRMVNYLMKTSKHLFIDGANKFSKILLTKVDDKWIMIKIQFSNENDKSICNVRIEEVVVKHPTESLENLKNDLFPQWDNDIRAIAYFKEMRAKMYEVIKLVNSKYDGTRETNNEIGVEIGKLLSEIKMKEGLLK